MRPTSYRSKRRLVLRRACRSEPRAHRLWRAGLRLFGLDLRAGKRRSVGVLTLTLRSLGFSLSATLPLSALLQLAILPLFGRTRLSWIRSFDATRRVGLRLFGGTRRVGI